MMIERYAQSPAIARLIKNLDVMMAWLSCPTVCVLDGRITLNETSARQRTRLQCQARVTFFKHG
eukprot:scaffold230539_cov31-Tisochrysis_lutea.AAC.1